MSIFVFIKITKLRVQTWKTVGMKPSKSYKHLALIPLCDIRQLFEMTSSSFIVEGKKIVSSILICSI